MSFKRRPGRRKGRKGDSVRNALVSYLTYIRQTFWPAGLGAYYPMRQSIPTWQAICACAVLLGLSALAVLAWRTRPYIPTGWFWYLGTLLPVIGLVQVGAQSHADRYMYVPLAGLSMILAWGAADVVRRMAAGKSRRRLCGRGCLPGMFVCCAGAGVLLEG